MVMPFSLVGFLGVVLANQRFRQAGKKNNLLRLAAGAFGLVLLLGMLLTAGGCGNYSAASNGTPRATTTVMITGTSGSISHSTSVTLTVQ